MNPEQAGFDQLIRRNLEPEIFSMQMLHLRLCQEASCAVTFL